MKKLLTVLICGISVFTLASCLTIKEKKIVEAPYRPDANQVEEVVDIENSFLVYFSDVEKPVIDGEFMDWDGLEGIHVRRMVYGGFFNQENTDGEFILRTDGEILYVYADITDDDVRPNDYEISQAWRGDSIEFFFGTDLSSHRFYKATDVRVRITSRSEDDIFDVGIGINDSPVQNKEIQAAVVRTETGYKVEASFPLSMLGGKKLSRKQKIRGDFQINDADEGKERSRLLHWNSKGDNTYMDASSWGNGLVVSLEK